MRSGPGEARTILLFHIISVRPSKQSRMVRTFLKVYMELGSYSLFLQEQINDIIIAGEGAARQNPTKLDAEDQEEAVDMAGKVLMRLDTAPFKCGIVRWKVGFAPGVMTVIIAVCSAACATAESTTSSRSVILTVRHVAVPESKTGKVDAGTTAGEGCFGCLLQNVKGKFIGMSRVA
jgi:hypothetical protein